MRLVAALVAIAVLLLSGPLAGSALAAPAAPAPTGARPAVTPEVGGPLRLELTQVGPRMVTADGPDTITVEGTLTNSGDAVVEGLAIRLQRGETLRTEGEVRTALDGRAPTDAVTPQFIDLPGELVPGASMPVRLAVPLRGEPATGLALSRPGVYELLVNVNGAPRDGVRARLAAARMLLPVLSLPADPTAAGEPAEPPAPATSPFTLLYPIVDAPRRLPTVPGETTTLTDDLADLFAPTGRLGGLVSALAQRAPVGSRLREATCVAVDPDLLQTASAMRQGYQVRAPDGTVTPGRGAEVAGQWLDALTAATRGGCVLALPFADADLVALTRGGLAHLATRAVADGRSITASILGTPVLDDALWPADGLLDEPALGAVGAGTDAGSGTVVLSAEGIDQGRVTRTTGELPIAGGPEGQRGVLTDPLLTLAAAGPIGATESSRTGPSSAVPVTSAPAGTSTPLSTQDVIGALAYRAAAGPAESSTGPLVLAPPHQWAVDGTGVGALLDAATRLLADGLLQPRALGAVVSAGPPPGTDSQRLSYPLRAGAREIPPAVVDAMRVTGGDVERLRAAADNEPGVGASPDAVFDPMLRDTLRPASSAWRGRPELAERSAEATTGRITELRSSVRVLEPPGPYSLGTADAPLLLTVANGLPVAMQVRVELASTAGLRVAPIPEQRIPPMGRIQVRVSAEVTRSGQFVVDASVRTPDGGPLGPPSRLHVRSTAYGTITVWLTATAGVLLVVLAARRILRRARGEPGRHTVPGNGPAGPTAPADPTSLAVPTGRAGPPGRARSPGPNPGPPDTSPGPRPRPPDPGPGPRARPGPDRGPVPGPSPGQRPHRPGPAPLEPPGPGRSSHPPGSGP
ncbi:DUF6049 family protein, partial [Pseudonocardia sp. H11422]|uniref:DUF6049 family protein n=1 Tax=Pseudonocardia sp. H11422 TaxID=2835866 RepID=UPI00292DA788